MVLNRNLKYLDAYMIYEDLSVVPEFKLPEGYSFKFFEEGNEKDWVEIEVSSGDIENEKSGYDKFEKYYGNYIDDIKKRMIFIVDRNNTPIGTATGFFMEKPIDDRITGDLHWVAVRKEFQGKGLSKPLITEAMKVMYQLGHKGAYLHSQTHTWLACKIYKSLGWKPYRPESQSIEDFEECWAIIDDI